MPLFGRTLPLLAIVTLMLSSCVVLPKSNIQPDTQLSGCLPFPNCVSTQSSSIIHSIDSFDLIMPLAQAWPVIEDTVLSLPNTKIKKADVFYIYAKSYSELFRFVDYVEVLGITDTNQLQVRSSSLLGFSDLGVNRRRSHELRDALIAKGLLAPL